MGSKRGIRRREQRIQNLKRQRDSEERRLDEKRREDEDYMAERDRSNLAGGIGRTSVADLILARTKMLKQQDAKPVPNKPSIPTPRVQERQVPAVAVEQPVENNGHVENIEDSIIASDRHKEMIFTEAAQNRDYYLEKKRADGNRKPWFHYVKKDSQYSEFVMLNNEMTKELLDHIWSEADGNRKVKDWLKEGYKRDIMKNHWIPSDESIGIDFDHVVYNGRHRLTALYECNKEWPFYMTFNALPEAKFTVDSGAKRNSAEKLRLVMETKMGNRTTGFCKALMKGLQYKDRYTETEIAEFAHKWEDLIIWVAKNLPGANRAEVLAAIAKAYLWYGPEKIEPFCERFREVKFMEEGDPARALFLALQRAKLNRINQALVAYKKTLAAIDATVSGKPMIRLFEKDDDLFNWEPGWEVPANSWWAKNHK